jgi:hypothetical protein
LNSPLSTYLNINDTILGKHDGHLMSSIHYQVVHMEINHAAIRSKYDILMVAGLISTNSGLRLHSSYIL